MNTCGVQVRKLVLVEKIERSQNHFVFFFGGGLFFVFVLF